MGEFAIDETSYSKTMKEIQPVDKVEAAFVNAIIGTLLNNDAYILKQVLNKIDIKSIIQDVDINDKNKIPSSAVTHLLKEQMDSLTLSAIQKTDIVQNAATDKTDKVVSAAVVKNLQDQITEQNTNKITKGDDDVLYINGKVLPMSKGIGELPVYSMHLMWHETDGWCVVIYFMYNNESYYGRAKLTDVVKK